MGRNKKKNHRAKNDRQSKKPHGKRKGRNNGEEKCNKSKINVLDEKTLSLEESSGVPVGNQKHLVEGTAADPTCVKLNFTTPEKAKIVTPKALKAPLSAKQLSTMKIAQSKPFKRNIAVKAPTVQNVTKEEQQLVNQMYLLLKQVKFKVQETAQVQTKCYCVLCNDQFDDKDVLKEDFGWMNKIRWKRLAKHLLNACVLYNPLNTDPNMKLLQVRLPQEAVRSLVTRKGKQQMNIVATKRKAVDINKEAEQYKLIFNHLNADANYYQPSQGLFDIYENSAQDTLDLLMVAILAEAPTSPYSLFDTEGFKRFGAFCASIGLEKYAGLSKGGRRISKLLRTKIPDIFKKQTIDAFKEVVSMKGCINLSIDGWQDSSGKRMVGYFISGPFLRDDFYAYCETKQNFKDTGSANAIAIEKYIQRCQEDLGIKIRCIITDEAGQCAMAHRILKPRHPDIIFEFCWAHQFDLVCKRIVSKFCTKYPTFDASLRMLVQKMNSKEHLKRRFLSLVQEKLGKTLKRPLISIADTRFNTYYLALSRILEYQDIVLEILQEEDVFGILTLFWQDTADPDLRKQALTTQANSFLTRCKILAALLRPVAKRVIKFQQRGLNKADVMYELIKVYIAYDRDLEFISKHDLQDIIDEIREDLSKRWHKCEQPLNLLTASLDLRYRTLVYEMLQVKKAKELHLPELLKFAVAVYYYRLIGKLPEVQVLDSDLNKFMNLTIVDPRPLVEENFPKQYHKLVRVNKFYNSSLFELGHLLVTSYCQSADNERQFSAYKQIQSGSRSNMSDAGMVALFQASQKLRTTIHKERRASGLPSLHILRGQDNSNSGVDATEVEHMQEDYIEPHGFDSGGSQNTNSVFHQSTVASSILDAATNNPSSPTNIVAQMFTSATNLNQPNMEDVEAVSTTGSEAVKNIFTKGNEGEEINFTCTPTQKKHLKTAEELLEFEGCPKEHFLKQYPTIDQNSPQERLEYLQYAVEKNVPSGDPNRLTLSRGYKIKLEDMVDIYKVVRDKRHQVSNLQKQQHEDHSPLPQPATKKQKTSGSIWKDIRSYFYPAPNN